MPPPTPLIKAAYILHQVSNRKIKQDSQEAKTSLVQLKLETTTSAHAALHLPKAFEVHSLKLARIGSGLERALSKRLGGQLGICELHTVGWEQSWHSVHKPAFLLFFFNHLSFYR